MRSGVDQRTEGAYPFKPPNCNIFAIFDAFGASFSEKCED